MAYNVVIAADFGAANTGKTVYGKLFGTDGVQVGSTVTTGFVEAVAGLYVYVLACPDNQEGVFVAYDSANTALRRVVVIAPRETENSDVKSSTLQASVDLLPDSSAIVAAIMASAVETGHSVEQVLQRIYAVIRGKSTADDGNDPTAIDYYAPDGTTVRVHHDLTDTERTPS